MDCSACPYGSVRPGGLGTLPTDRTFTGQIADASTGLMFYNARYYSPLITQGLISVGSGITGFLITTPNGVNARELRQAIDAIDKLVDNVRNTSNQYVTISMPQYLDYYYGLPGRRVNPEAGWNVNLVFNSYYTNRSPIRPGGF